jgi:LysR family transcriptional regulator for bpeEF and oprC
VSTSAVSAAVLRLEQKLAARLLNRTTRRVSPTPEGVEFYQRCKQIIADLEQAEISVSRSGGVPSGRLRIGMPSALGRMWVIPMLTEFVRAYPSIALEFVIGDLITGSGEGLDASIQVGELPSSRATVRKLTSVDYVVCAAPQYLAARGVPAKPGDLANHDCLSYRRPRNGRIRQWRFASGRSIEPHDVSGFMTFNSGEALAAAAAAGLGVAQIAEYYAQPGIQSGTLVEILVNHKARAHDISIVFQRQKRMAPRLRVFIDFLVDLFASPPWASPQRRAGGGYQKRYRSLPAITKA